MTENTEESKWIKENKAPISQVILEWEAVQSAGEPGVTGSRPGERDPEALVLAGEPGRTGGWRGQWAAGVKGFRKDVMGPVPPSMSSFQPSTATHVGAT